MVRVPLRARSGVTTVVGNESLLTIGLRGQRSQAARAGGTCGSLPHSRARGPGPPSRLTLSLLAALARECLNSAARACENRKGEEREPERERERERERESEGGGERERKREREREREREGERAFDRQTDSDRQTDRQTECVCVFPCACVLVTVTGR